MIIYLLFLVFVFIFSIKGFKKGIIYYAPFKFLFSYGIPSHIGTLGLDSVFTLALFFIWYLFYRNKYSINGFPLKKSVIILIIAAFIYSTNPVFSIQVLLNEISPYLYLIMFFSAINTKEDIKAFIKILCIYIICLNVNGLFELLGNNIIGNALTSVISKDTYWANDVVQRGIFVRLHSFVPHSIGFGVENVVFFSFFFAMFYYGKELMNRKIAIFFMIFCFIGLFLSGSRSPLLGGMIIMLPLILNKQTFKSKNLIFLTTAIIIIVSLAGNYFITMYESLTSDATTDIGGASSWEMRLGQLEYSVFYWMQQFWLGHGHTFDIFGGGRFYSEIFGAESVWFPIMMKKGLLGIVSYLYITIEACMNIPQHKYRRLCLFLMLGWLVIDSATNLPGLNILLPLYFYSIYYKYGYMDAKSVLLKSVKL